MVCCSTKRSSFLPLILIVIALGAVMFVRGRPAPTPPMFAQAVSFETALEQSEATGKPVFLLATTDWCGSCQSLKRGALTNEELELLVGERAIPVYLDATSNSSAGSQVARELGVRAFPTLMLIEDGQEVSRAVGSQSAAGLIKWLESAMAVAAAAEPAMPDAGSDGESTEPTVGGEG